MNNRRTVAGVMIMIVGVAFIGVALVNKLFSVGPAFEDMTVGFRTQMSDQNIATLRQDLAAMGAVSEEFSTKVVPAMSQAFKMTPEQFSAYMSQTFPAVAGGVEALPQIGPRFGAVVDTLEAEQARFASADAIPATSLPATTVPWSILAAGIAAIIVGGFVLRPGAIGPSLAIVLGILLIAGPLFLSLPGKAADADTMNANLKPVYTAELVSEARGGLATIGAMGTQLQAEMLPAIAKQLGMTTEQASAYFAKEFPTMSAATANLPAMLGRFTTTVNVFDENIGNYNTLKTVSFEPIVWTLIAGGAVVLLFAAISFTGAATRSHAPVIGMRPSKAA